jgi:hypothetical protein
MRTDSELVFGEGVRISHLLQPHNLVLYPASLARNGINALMTLDFGFYFERPRWYFERSSRHTWIALPIKSIKRQVP